MSITMNALLSPKGACAAGETCSAGRCAPSTNPDDPGIGAGCSMQLVGAGPFGVPLNLGGDVASAPAVAVTETGFLVAYREYDPAQGIARLTDRRDRSGRGAHGPYLDDAPGAVPRAGRERRGRPRLPRRRRPRGLGAPAVPGREHGGRPRAGRRGGQRETDGLCARRGGSPRALPACGGPHGRELGVARAAGPGRRERRRAVGPGHVREPDGLRSGSTAGAGRGRGERPDARAALRRRHDAAAAARRGRSRLVGRRLPRDGEGHLGGRGHRGDARVRAQRRGQRRAAAGVRRVRPRRQLGGHERDRSPLPARAWWPGATSRSTAIA